MRSIKEAGMFAAVAGLVVNSSGIVI